MPATTTEIPVTCTQIKELETAKAKWALKGWNDYHSVLVAESSCLVQLGKVLLKFYLRPLEKTHEFAGSIVRLNYYSLMVKVLSQHQKSFHLRVDMKVEPVYTDDFTEDEKVNEEICSANVQYDKNEPNAELVVEENLIYNGCITTSLQFAVAGDGPLKYDYYFEDCPELNIYLRAVLLQPETDIQPKTSQSSAETKKSSGVNLGEADLQNFYDVELIMKDSVSLPAHRLILAASSPVFRTMFTSDMKESRAPSVTITDIDSPAMKILLNFIYTQEVDNGWTSLVSEVVYAANKYVVQAFLDFVDDKLIEICNAANALDLLKLAKLYRMTKSITRVSEYIQSNTAEVLMELEPSE